MKPLLLILLALAACTTTDRTPKKKADANVIVHESGISGELVGGTWKKDGVAVVKGEMVVIDFRFATKEKPFKQFHYDGGSWCDVYADKLGIHWKPCEAPE